MEDILDLYQQPYDAHFPLICMDEGAKQLLSEYQATLPARAGQPVRYDYQYFHCGVANLFICCEPLTGWRQVQVQQRRTKREWALAMQALVNHFPDAQRIRLVLDNLNTHRLGSLYATFEPHEARRIADKLELHYTPKHGSWLNMAEIELSVLARQCLDRRLDRLALVEAEVSAWVAQRNQRASRVDWRFTTADARIKLKRLYPHFHP